MTVAIPKWRLLKFGGGVVQSVIQTWHCLTVVSIGLLDTQSNTFRPLFNKDLNNFVITELVSTI